MFALIVFSAFLIDFLFPLSPPWYPPELLRMNHMLMGSDLWVDEHRDEVAAALADEALLRGVPPEADRKGMATQFDTRMGATVHDPPGEGLTDMPVSVGSSALFPIEAARDEWQLRVWASVEALLDVEIRWRSIFVDGDYDVKEAEICYQWRRGEKWSRPDDWRETVCVERGE